METNQNQENQQRPSGFSQQQKQYQQPYYQYMPTDNLSTFATLHLVKGILTILFSLFFLLYMFVGTALTFGSMNHGQDMPFHPGNIFIIIGAVGFIITVSIGILTLLAGKYIKERRNYNFIFAIAIINCITGILGVLLGVFTILDLNKPHVKAQFEPGYDPQNPFGQHS
jgi:NADH:ubiquinone oxidoreductase subunit 6 (subunit J)